MDYHARICTFCCSGRFGPPQTVPATHVMTDALGLGRFGCPQHALEAAWNREEVLPLEVWWDEMDQQHLLTDIIIFEKFDA